MWEVQEDEEESGVSLDLLSQHIVFIVRVLAAGVNIKHTSEVIN